MFGTVNSPFRYNTVFHCIWISQHLCYVTPLQQQFSSTFHIINLDSEWRKIFKRFNASKAVILEAVSQWVTQSNPLNFYFSTDKTHSFSNALCSVSNFFRISSWNSCYLSQNWEISHHPNLTFIKILLLPVSPYMLSVSCLKVMYTFTYHHIQSKFHLWKQQQQAILARSHTEREMFN